MSIKRRLDSLEAERQGQGPLMPTIWVEGPHKLPDAPWLYEHVEREIKRLSHLWRGALVGWPLCNADCHGCERGL